jgi:hypothetical protein
VAERPGAEGHDIEHAPHDAHVLEEMIELVLVLLRVHRPEVVEDERKQGPPHKWPVLSEPLPIIYESTLLIMYAFRS